MLRLVALLLLSSPVFTLAQDAGADPLVPLALSRHLDRLWRSDSSEVKGTMKVVTPDCTRTLSLDVWSEGMEHTLIRITAPRKEAGVSTLKRGNEIWNDPPKIRKTIRIPPSMMMGSWMGSGLTLGGSP